MTLIQDGIEFIVSSIKDLQDKPWALIPIAIPCVLYIMLIFIGAHAIRWDQYIHSAQLIMIIFIILFLAASTAIACLFTLNVIEQLEIREDEKKDYFKAFTKAISEDLFDVFPFVLLWPINFCIISKAANNIRTAI